MRTPLSYFEPPLWPSSILSLLIGIAGWYYLFYSKAAGRLEAVESQSINLRRVVLRRLNGAVMIALAVLLYIGTRGVDFRELPRRFLAIWLAIAFLLMVAVVLAMIDMRFTMRLRRRDRDNEPLP